MNTHLSSHYFLEAKGRNGIVQNKNLIHSLPRWVDEEKIRDGQEFVRHNFFSVFFAHLLSLIFLLSYTPVRIVLMRTGKSESTLNSLKRYLSTLLHIKLWYEHDILKPHGQAKVDIEKIRKIHGHVAKLVETSRMKKSPLDVSQVSHIEMKVKVEVSPVKVVSIPDTQLICALQQDFSSHLYNYDNNNNNWPSDQRESDHVISQLDMIVTQFCFMGLITLYPKHFGIHNHNYSDKDDGEKENVKGLEGFIHLWALIGHLLGIDDQFNLCLTHNADKIPLVLKQILIPELQNCHPTTIVLWRSLTNGISSFVPFISLYALLAFVKNILDTPLKSTKEEDDELAGHSSSNKLSSLLSLYDILCYRLMAWCFSSWLQHIPLRTLFNGLLRLAVYLSSLRFMPI